MKEINIDNWVRKKQYLFFKDFEDPFFNITANIDVTKLKIFCQVNKLSFFLSTLYFSNLAANEIEAFRYRLVEGKVFVLDEAAVGSTVFKEDETFAYCYFKMHEDIKSFCYHGAKVIDKCTKSDILDGNRESLDLIYYSVIPWVSFTAMKHPHNGWKSESIPRIVFGKYFTQGDKLMMPVSVDVNHALMDGYHVGQYFKTFQEYIDKSKA